MKIDDTDDRMPAWVCPVLWALIGAAYLAGLYLAVLWIRALARTWQ